MNKIQSKSLIIPYYRIISINAEKGRRVRCRDFQFRHLILNPWCFCICYQWEPISPPLESEILYNTFDLIDYLNQISNLFIQPSRSNQLNLYSDFVPLGSGAANQLGQF